MELSWGCSIAWSPSRLQSGACWLTESYSFLPSPWPHCSALLPTFISPTLCVGHIANPWGPVLAQPQTPRSITSLVIATVVMMIIKYHLLSSYNVQDTLHILLHWIFAIIFQRRCFCSHLTDEKTKPQRGQVTWSSSHSREDKDSGFESRSLWPQSPYISHYTVVPNPLICCLTFKII